MVDYGSDWFKKAQGSTGPGQEQADVWAGTAKEKIYLTNKSTVDQSRVSSGGGGYSIPIPMPGQPVQTTRTDILPSPSTQSVIEAGPYTEAPMKAEDIKPSGMGYSLTNPISIPTQSSQSNRIISSQETASTESESSRIDIERRGQQQIEGPTTQAKEFSHSVFGDPEDYYYPEQKIVASSAEWFISLPAETVKSGVTASQIGGEIIRVGPGGFISEQIKYISKDIPARAAPVVLSAVLVAAPVGKSLIGRVRSAPVESISVPIDEAPRYGGWMIYDTEAIYTKSGKDILGSGVTNVRYGASADRVTITTKTRTTPSGNVFLTTGESKIAVQSRIDLTSAKAIEGTLTKSSITETGDISRTFGIEASDFRQRNLMGRPAPKLEQIEQLRISRPSGEFGELGFSVSRSGGRPPGVSLSRTVLINEAKGQINEGPVTFRSTRTIEAYMEADKFQKILASRRGPADLGISQETIRGFEKGTKGFTKPSESAISSAEQGMMSNIRDFLDTRPPQAPKPTKIDATFKQSSSSRSPARMTISPIRYENVQIQRPSQPGTNALPGKFDNIQSPWSGRAGLSEQNIQGYAGISSRLDVQAISGQSSGQVLGLTQTSGLGTGQFGVSGNISGEMSIQTQGQGGLQRQLTAQSSMAQTRQLMLSPRPPIRLERFETTSLMLRREPTRRIPSIPHIPLPPLEQPQGGRRRKKRKKHPLISHAYSPSLIGIQSGLTITKPVKGVLTGLEERFPIKRRRI